MALLEVIGVSKAFGSVRALAGVDLRVDAGERLALIGPNGSGKTTLFNVATGFSRPTSGHVRFADHDVTRTSFEARARRGLVRTFQHDAVFPGLSVEDNVRLPLRRRRRRRRRSDGSGVPDDLDAVLELASLTGVRRRLAGQLAYGFRRLLGVAVAAATNPQMIMLDEPAAGLNDAEAADLAGMLRQLHGFGTTIVVIEHDMSFVASLCTRTVVLNAGKVIAAGTPDEVRRDPLVAEAYLGELVADAV